MQAFGAALLVTVVLVVLFLLIGLPLIKEIEQARIQHLLIAERMSQHRQQTTLILAGIIAFVLMSLVFGYFLLQEREHRREHQRWVMEYQARLPQPTQNVYYIQTPSRREAFRQVSELSDGADDIVVIEHPERRLLR